METKSGKRIRKFVLVVCLLVVVKAMILGALYFLRRSQTRTERPLVLIHAPHARQVVGVAEGTPNQSTI
jgi:hypothetical protein